MKPIGPDFGSTKPSERTKEAETLKNYDQQFTNIPKTQTIGAIEIISYCLKTMHIYSNF